MQHLSAWSCKKNQIMLIKQQICYDLRYTYTCLLVNQICFQWIFSKDYASMVFKRLLLKPYRGHCYHQNILVLGTNYVAGDVHLQLEL